MATTDEVAPTAGSAGLLQWSVSGHDHEIEVVLRGELDLASADTLTELLVEVMRNRAVPVVCDLAKVSFLDSTGIRALLNAAEAASESGSVLTVRNPTPAVLRVLEICGVDTVLLAPPGDTATHR